MSDKNIIDFENEKVEYKVELSSDKDSIKKWEKTLVGFANTYGGTLCWSK